MENDTVIVPELAKVWMSPHEVTSFIEQFDVAAHCWMLKYTSSGTLTVSCFVMCESH